MNDGTGLFTDQSARAGLRTATLPFTGFGAGWLDFDNDGWLDAATVNGRVTHPEESLTQKLWFGLRQRRQLFRGLGNATFQEVSGRAGAAFAQEEVGRGAAFGDVDNDGDTDIVVANDNGPLRLLVNEVGSRAHWVGLRLTGSPGGTAQASAGRSPVRDMLGARVMITRGDGQVLWRRARADGSYASANDPRVLAGLGPTTAAPRVRVIWPDGRAEEWTDVPIDRYTTLEQGTGTAGEARPSP